VHPWIASPCAQTAKNDSSSESEGPFQWWSLATVCRLSLPEPCTVGTKRKQAIYSIATADLSPHDTVLQLRRGTVLVGYRTTVRWQHSKQELQCQIPLVSVGTGPNGGNNKKSYTASIDVDNCWVFISEITDVQSSRQHMK
jgi:hypothetical protein